jgi:hypothetical protein
MYALLKLPHEQEARMDSDNATSVASFPARASTRGIVEI